MRHLTRASRCGSPDRYPVLSHASLRSPKGRPNQPLWTRFDAFGAGCGCRTSVSLSVAMGTHAPELGVRVAHHLPSVATLIGPARPLVRPRALHTNAFSPSFAGVPTDRFVRISLPPAIHELGRREQTHEHPNDARDLVGTSQNFHLVKSGPARVRRRGVQFQDLRLRGPWGDALAACRAR
jgi:hypothetical protein